MSIANLVTGDILHMQYNPTEIEEQLAVVYARPTITGQSHQPLQYTNTGNLEVNIDLAFDALAQTDSQYAVMGARNWLMSLCYSESRGSTVNDGAPPRVLFMWPNLYSLTSVVTKYKGKFTRFAADGRPSALAVTLSIEEIRDVRLLGREVRLDGTLRAATPGK